MQRFTTRLALAALAALALSSPRLAAAAGYTITDLGTGTLSSTANGFCWQQTINNGGLLACYANTDAYDPSSGQGDPENAFDSDSSFLWNQGTVTHLPGLNNDNAIDTTAFSVNNRGQVVGRSTVTLPLNHAVLWDHGVIQQLLELSTDKRSAALKINDRGQAVGYSRLGSTRHAVLWQGGITPALLPPLPDGVGGSFDEGLGINELGQIVGISGIAMPPPGSPVVHPVLWNQGTQGPPINLGSLPGGGGVGTAYAINNNGQVVGQSTAASGALHPFIWQNGVGNDLRVLPNDKLGVAYSINDQGQVVGSSQSDPNDIETSHALLWENGMMTVLQTKIPVGSGWMLLVAGGINNQGRINGFGLHNGNFRGFLLTPDQNE